MRISALILNYNDHINTIELATTLASYSCINKVLIVDNRSTDESIEELSLLASSSPKIDLIESNNNGGYAAGNNLGLKILIGDDSCEHVLIANPDIRVDESVIKELSAILLNHDDCAACGCQQVNPLSSRSVKSYWDLPTFSYDLRSLFFIGRMLNRKLHVDHSFNDDGTSFCVDAVSGSMFLADLKKLSQIDLFDEGTFLYCEENILGKRCALHNFKIRFAPRLTFYHYHATSTRKTFGLVRSMDLLHQSMLYYHKRYESLTKKQELLFRMCMPLSKMEFYIIAFLSLLYQ